MSDTFASNQSGAHDRLRTVYLFDDNLKSFQSFLLVDQLIAPKVFNDFY